MSKLFVFGIGGTGARVLRSLTMLLMAGVKTNNNIDEIIPIVIEKDSTNGDMARTTRIINNYIDTRAKYVAGTDKFFSTKMSYLSAEKNLQMTLTDNNEEFSKYIGFDQLTDSTKAFVEILFSKESLEMKTTEGFRGVPSIGSVVLNQFENSKFFNTFASRFNNGDKIFIISSIFGGTGASGFPLLVKTLRGESDRQGWDNVKKAPIGAISVLPYFNVNNANEENKVNVDSGTFNSKAKAALAYYERTLGNGMVNHMYFVGDKKMSTYKYCSGGGGQINPAHFVEVVSALSIIDFINRDNANAEGTSYHEFGLYEPRKGQNPCEIRFGDLGSETLNAIRKPLIQFYAFKQYMGLVFDEEYRHQPWAHNYPWNRDKNFGEDEKNKLTACFLDFKTWLEELNGEMKGYEDTVPGHHRFSPFNMKSQTIAFVLNREDDVIAVNNNRYKDWAWFDNELNRYKKGISALDTKQRFMEIFYKATEKFVELISSPQSQEGERRFKVLTLRKEDASAQGDWQNLQNSPYGEEQLLSISESNSTSTTEPTSIPSPFARMEVARTAFKNVTEILRKEIKDGNRTRPAEWRDVPCRYQKTVSDCLDVAEIFFNYEQYKDFVEIIKWNVRDLDEIEKKLKNNPDGDSIKKNVELVRVMKKFIDADNSIYNFDRMNSIYLLNYIGDNRPEKISVNIIGATSPVTMFFSVGNDLSYVNKKIKFRGSHNPFDGNYTPLEKRDPNFIKYLSNYIGEYNRAYPDIENKFAADFTVLNEYLEVALNRVPNNINLNDAINDLKKISVGQNDSEHVTVLGQSIYCMEPRLECSDFYINSSEIAEGEKRPLVLPDKKGNDYKDYKYVSEYDKWGEDREAPKFNQIDINKRILPDTNIKYPYLTMSDFIEDRIIILEEQKFDTTHYLDFGYCDKYCDENKQSTILMPIKPLFFRYFSVSDLKKMLSFEENASLIVLSLAIPVSGGTIKFQKTYSSNDIDKVDYSFAVFPLVKFNVESQSMYRVALAADYDKFDSYSLELYQSDNIVEANDSFERNQTSEGDIKCRVYSLEGRTFDYARLAYKGNYGLAIPNFKEANSNGTFSFSIDFGTTNTHIEYKIEGGAAEPIPFDITKEDVQLCPLAEPKLAYKLMYEMDLVPKTIGVGDYRFPMRTALCCSEKTVWDGDKIPYLQGSVAFSYEKLKKKIYNAPTITGLKWLNLNETDNSSANEKKIKCYIESLLFLVRNKVLLNGGDLAKTKICWFYPISMIPDRLEKFKGLWKNAYKKFFGRDIENIYYVAESIAPYAHFKEKYTRYPKILTIDIGGGTTDVAYGKNNDIKFISSFRFAANSIFGTSNNDYGDLNGIVKKHIEYYKDGLKNDSNLKETLKTLEENKDSENLASFFFSVHNNIKNNNDDFDFIKRLGNDGKSKIVLLTFYTAIIYHVVSIIKAMKLETPNLIAFSGNGSRVLKSITSDIGGTLNEYTKKIVELSGENNCNFEIGISENPKEATCKGGINILKEIEEDKNKVNLYKDVSNKKVVLKGLDNKSFVTENDKYSGIDKQYVEKVVDVSVNNFLNLLVNCFDKFGVGRNFGIDKSAIKIAGELFKNRIQLINNVTFELNRKRGEVGDGEVIEETMFFYPIIGLLEDLSYKVNSQSDGAKSKSENMAYNVNEQEEK